MVIVDNGQLIAVSWGYLWNGDDLITEERQYKSLIWDCGGEKSVFFCQLLLRRWVTLDLELVEQVDHYFTPFLPSIIRLQEPFAENKIGKARRRVPFFEHFRFPLLWGPSWTISPLLQPLQFHLQIKRVFKFCQCVKTNVCSVNV